MKKPLYVRFEGLDLQEQLELQNKALSGDTQAVKDFVLFSAYKEIKSDKFIPKRKKRKVFEALETNLNVTVEVV